MKLTAAFAVLAVLASKATVVFAATDYDALMEARSEFIESALEEVWERFYNEVLEEVGTRAYHDDLLDFEARDYDDVFDHEARDYDEDIFERSPMKKFGKDLLTGVLQKTPSWHKQNEAKKEREKPKSPRMAPMAQQAQAQAKGRPSTPKNASVPPKERFKK